jgi:hypothetical protein
VQRHSFPKLADAHDVAADLLDQIAKAHAVKGGSRAEFAAAVKRRLAAWKPESSQLGEAYRKFRAEVHGRLTRSLDAWVDLLAPLHSR